MKTAIFIRTYHRDIAWLTYALRSIAKHCKGFDEVIICIPQSQRHLLNHLTFEKIVTCPDYKQDYIGQQASKLLAYTYTNADYVFFTDSDCIFLHETTPNDFLDGDKPIVLKTPYSQVGDAICWKTPTEKALRSPVEFEYMRRHPSMWHRDTLENINKHLGGTENYVMVQQSFSEFNLMGAYAERYEPDKYAFVNTDMPTINTSKGETNVLHQQFVKQFYSHTGVTSFRDEIEKLLA